MKTESTAIPGRTFPEHFPGNLDYEFHRLQNALMGLESELFQTGELIQTLNEYIHEKHIIALPLHRCSGRQKKEHYNNPL